MKYFYLILLLLTLACGGASLTKEARLSIEETEGQLIVRKGQQKILVYQMALALPSYDAPAHYQRNGFIHPVYSPGGEILTDDFPLDHAHQHAVFMAWVNTTFRGDKIDFWNQQKGTGTVAHSQLIRTDVEKDSAVIEVALQHLSLKHGPILQEHWTITVFDRADYFLWELRSVQKNTTSDTLFVNSYKYGNLGIRGRRAWNPSDSLHFRDSMKVVTSEGLSRLPANHSRPSWVAMYGGGVGLAVIDHPSNFRYPQPIRVHPEMPYFCKAPIVGEGFELGPGEEIASRYRFVVFDGAVPVKLLNEECSY